MKDKVYCTLTLGLCLLTLLLTGCWRSSAGNEPAGTSPTPIPRLMVEPLPTYLVWVRPSPGAALVTEFFQKDSWLHLQDSDLNKLSQAVCIGLLTFDLLEPGDSLTGVNLMARLSVHINGRVFQEIQEYYWTDDHPIVPQDLDLSIS
jgi:hypothetical protein